MLSSSERNSKQISFFFHLIAALRDKLTGTEGFQVPEFNGPWSPRSTPAFVRRDCCHYDRQQGTVFAHIPIFRSASETATRRHSLKNSAVQIEQCRITVECSSSGKDRLLGKGNSTMFVSIFLVGNGKHPVTVEQWFSGRILFSPTFPLKNSPGPTEVHSKYTEDENYGTYMQKRIFANVW